MERSGLVDQIVSQGQQIGHGCTMKQRIAYTNSHAIPFWNTQAIERDAPHARDKKNSDYEAMLNQFQSQAQQ
jgi:hypothetical protein